MNGERFAVNLNWQSARIAEVGFEGSPDIFERPPILLGVTYGKEIDIAGTPIEFSLVANNLLGEEQLFEQGNDTFENFLLGRTFSIGLTARF